MTNLTELYGKSFYDSLEQSTFQSAEVIVPLVMQLLSPRGVIDVGCGRGIWLRAFQDRGVSNVRGIDGNHAATDNLFIPRDNFTPADLSKPFSIEGTYDLAVCLEVAEHIPDSVAAGLVRKLTNAAPCVLFSAAIPGQGGQHHINEQWPEYWHERFRSNRFTPFDYFRPKLLHDKSVAWWYRQNLVLYVSDDYIDRNRHLAERLSDFQNCDLEWVYRLANGDRYKVNLTLRSVLRMMPGLFWRALNNRLGYFRRDD